MFHPLKPLLSISMALVLGLLFAFALTLVLGAGINVQAAGVIRYVATAGTDGANTCTNSNSPCATLQHAVDAAVPNDEIRIAGGTYTSVQGRPAPAGYDGPNVITQMVYISKSIAIRGGYTTAFTGPPDPNANPTTLDAAGQGRVIFIAGEISTTVEGLCITNGDSVGLGGSPGGIVLDSGGGIYIITATAAISANSIFSNTTLFAGGGIFLLNSSGMLTNNVVISNSAGYGGGIGFYNSSATLNKTIIRANTAKGAGGGLRLYDSDLTVRNSGIISNAAVFGGGFYIQGGNVTLSENSILSNAAPSFGSSGGIGGGLLMLGVTATLTGNTISANTAGIDGGGAYIKGGDATFSKNAVTGNNAYSGAGLSFWYGSKVKLNDNLVSNNAPGALTFYEDSSGTLINNIIADNEQQGFYISASAVDLIHNTIARNGDYGVEVRPGSSFPSPDTIVTMTNTILVSHTVGITVESGSTAKLEATLWGGGEWANGIDWGGSGNITTGTINIWGDPAFAAPESGNYHLRFDSAALDQGVDAGVTTDIDGESRPYGAGYDLGADESKTGLTLTKMTSPIQADSRLTYTLRVTNIGFITLTATITDTLPEHGTPAGLLTWSPTLTAPGGVWIQQVVITVEEGYVGPLVNAIQVSSEEGARGIYTHTLNMGRGYYLPVIFKEGAGNP